MIRGYSSMTCFPMVFLVWFAAFLLGKSPTKAITLFLDRGRAKNPRQSRDRLGKKSSGNGQSWPLRFLGPRSCQNPRQLAAAGKKYWGNRHSWRSRFDWIAFTPKPADSLGKFDLETVYHGDSPKKKRRSRQNRRFATRLGKFPAEPAYHGDREKTCDRIGETVRIGEAGRARPHSKFKTTFVPS